MKPIYHVAIALLRRDGLWLVARRFDDAHLGGVWEFPGGKCERDETPTAAAVRELREECGVEGRAVSALPEFEVDYEDRAIVLHPVLCDWIRGEAAALGSQECRWVRLCDLQQLDMPAANARIVAALSRL